MKQNGPKQLDQESESLPPLLVVDDLHAHFVGHHRRVRAVDGVSFVVMRGATLGVVGESGSGKSVLARTLIGLLPANGLELSGSVRFNGTELIGLSRKAKRRFRGPGVAMVFQDPMTSLNPVMKIGKQITESLRTHMDVSRAEARDRAVQLLEDVHVPQPSRRVLQYPHELSGGMRQRIAIAIALACSPELLIADEPTTALDVTIQAEILDLLDELRRERGMSLILISHDLGVVADRTEEIAVMYAGRIVEQAPTESIFERMRMPYTEALFQAIPRLENPSHTRLQAIPGRPPDPTRQTRGCPFHPRCRYAQERCVEEAPRLRVSEAPDHQYACWFPLDDRSSGSGSSAGASELEAPDTLASTKEAL